MDKSLCFTSKSSFSFFDHIRRYSRTAQNSTDSRDVASGDNPSTYICIDRCMDGGATAQLYNIPLLEKIHRICKRAH